MTGLFRLQLPLLLHGVIVGCWFAELVCETSGPKGSRGFDSRMTPSNFDVLTTFKLRLKPFTIEKVPNEYEE